MTIRVTLGMLNNQFVRNLNNNLMRTERLQDQLSSGKMVARPSDDPVGITFSMRYRSEIAANQQHQRNMDAANSLLENIDVTLEQATSLFQRVRELTVQAANDTNDKSARDAIALEIEQISAEFINIGNTKYNGKYIFNGQLIDIEPYPKDISEAKTAKTDIGVLEYEVGIGITLPVSVTGNEVFGNPDEADNWFGVLEGLVQAMRSNDTKGINDRLELIDTRIDKMLGTRAVVGSRMNRMEFISERLNDIDLNLTKLQSKVEDANMGDLITQMKTQESVYQASLATGAKIITPTLIDFLR